MKIGEVDIKKAEAIASAFFNIAPETDLQMDYSSTVNTNPSERPNTSGKNSCRAVVGMTWNSPGIVACR